MEKLPTKATARSAHRETVIPTVPHDDGHLWHAVLPAAATYALTGFLTGFVCGTVRVLVLVPALGAVAAVLLELPIMLIAGWLLTGWNINRYHVAATVPARAIMGLVAFTVLMMFEFLLAGAVFGQSPRSYVEDLATVAGRLGLAGQLLFAALPALRLGLVPIPTHRRSAG